MAKKTVKAETVESVSATEGEIIVEPPKRKRGRPRKTPVVDEAAPAVEAEAVVDVPVDAAVDVSAVEMPAAETPAETAVAEPPVVVEAAQDDVASENNDEAHEAEAVVQELPKRGRKARRSMAEILADAEKRAAAMSQRQQAIAAMQDQAPVEGDADQSQEMVTEASFGVAGEGNGDEAQLGLLEQLQNKVEAHNAEYSDGQSGEEEDNYTEWEGDPADGTDFIIIKDLPVEDNAAIPYYDMFDNPTSAVMDKVDVNPVVGDNALQYDFNDLLTSSGLLEVLPDGYGFLRSSDYNYLSSPDDVYLSGQQIRQYALKTGDTVECRVRPPRDNEKYFVMSSILSVNGRSPFEIRDRISFENLTPLFPEEKFCLEGSPRTTNYSTRIVDMFAPIGKGQRSLIVAQPKTGKTMLMKDIANAIAANHPEAYIMMLLIDERPEEVTDMARTVNAEVIASTFDEPADRHVKIAGLVLEKAKRLVECGHDVVIFLDSITRLARAYNTVAPASGKVLTGGVDANALQKPKRFFGAARNIEEGGSLTIIATALTDTGSKMDEVIFEEFKGTGNSELQLDRQLANRRIFPAVNIVQSSTRRDDLLLDKEHQNLMWVVRGGLNDMTSIEAMKKIQETMRGTYTNKEFFEKMQKEGGM